MQNKELKADELQLRQGEEYNEQPSSQLFIGRQTSCRKVLFKIFAVKLFNGTQLYNVMTNDSTINVDSSTETTPRVTNQEMKMPIKKAMKLPNDDDDTTVARAEERQHEEVI